MILTFQISSYFVRTEIQEENDIQDLVTNFSRTDGIKYSFLTVL